jgi:hypothetical protein
LWTKNIKIVNLQWMIAVNPGLVNANEGVREGKAVSLRATEWRIESGCGSSVLLTHPRLSAAFDWQRQLA